MTATQIFLRFLKEELECEEYLFFMHFLHNHGNRYFKNRKLFHDTFVEDYLCRANRPLYGFMKRLFILAPNLKNYSNYNKRYKWVKEEWLATHDTTKTYRDREGYQRMVVFFPNTQLGMYVNYYNRKWHDFLDRCIDKETSPSVRAFFKEGKKLEFNFKPMEQIFLEKINGTNHSL